MPRIYYASKLSENISKTPEGYLICKNVPIARTGTQEYLASELGINDSHPDRLVTVNRSEEEVFSAAALASFEGKPLTDNHPNEKNVCPDNVSRLMKGICIIVRRGEGEDSDKVIADIIVYDPVLISEVMGGKRGISCGYDCDYEIDEEGIVQQKNIRGNHVAVVSAGRAGNDVSIQDNAPVLEKKAPVKTERRYRNMAKTQTKNTKAGLIGRLFPMFAQDADPQQVAEVIEALLDEPAADEPPAQPAPVEKPAEENKAPANAEEGPPKWAKDMMDKFDAAIAAMKPADADPLEKLESELAGGEEGVTKEAEGLGEDAAMDEGNEDIDPAADEDPRGTGTNDSRDAALAAIRSMKPIIAGIKDEKQRLTASDSMAKLIRASLGATPAAKTSGYSAILDVKVGAAKKQKVKDAKPNDRAQQEAELGMKLAEKYNPHYKKQQ